MKKIYLTLFLLTISLFVSAQDYRFFIADSQKTFTSWPSAGRSFSLAFDSTTTSGSSTAYYPVNKLAEYEIMMSDSCLPMNLSGYCFPENAPSWAGSQITVNSSNDQYTFQTIAGIPLNLNLQAGAGQPSLFYEDSLQKFYLTRSAGSLEEIMGITDSIRNYIITHTDPEGNQISSALNNFVLKTGKVIGLINFFRIDSFPQLLQPVSLIGNFPPEAGLTLITNEDLYDYQPGDEVQFNEQSINFTCHPEILYNRYTKLNYLQRIDEPDTIRYQCRRETFYVDSLLFELDTIWTAYNRHTVIAQMPFDYNNHSELLSRKELFMGDYCGEPLWTFKKTFMHSGYCEESNCWTWVDILGIPMEEVETNVMGIGRYSYSSSQLIEGEVITYIFQMNYFRKGILSCGDEQVVSTNDIIPAKNRLVIVPNPASDYIQVNGIELLSASVNVIDVNGKNIITVSDYNSNERIYIGGLEKGVYLVRVSYGNNISTVKLVK